MPRIMVVANETVGAEELLAALRALEDEHASTYRVVVPAHPLTHTPREVWTQAGAQEAAHERLATTLAILHGEGLDADGVIGDLDPMAAIRDALLDFDADLLVISTHPLGRSTWLRRNVVDRARARFRRDVIHVVSHVREGAPA